MKKILIFLCATLALLAQANVYQWTNTLSGSWLAYTNWSPNGVPGLIPANSDVAYITNSGSYSVFLTNGSTTVTLATLIIGGNGGAPTLVVDNSATLSPVNAVIASGGMLVASNLWMNGTVSVLSGGQFQLAGTGNKVFYSLAVANQGTLTWSGGSIVVGGSAGTQLYNSGLFLITGDNSTGYGGGAGALLLNNSGTVRKTAGTGASSFSLSLVNQPGALVEALSGTLAFTGSTNLVAGNFNGVAPGKIALTSGIWMDAGGTFSGTGTNQFTGGTFNLRTNPPPGLQFVGGDLYITGTNTFQQAGAITNLAIDGATLHGTNTVAGTLSFTSGAIADQVTILPGGQWLVSGSANKLLGNLTSLNNQGTVVCGGTMTCGGNNYYTNNGLWLFTNDSSFSYGGGGSTITFVNNGTVSKSGGTGTSQFSAFNFINAPGGLVTASSGIFALACGSGATNILGGTFTSTSPGQILISGTTFDAGGVCNGTGTNQFTDGTFDFRTNTIPGLQLTGGNLVIVGTNTFQNAGAITDLTLDGPTLIGTNSVNGGTLTMKSGYLSGQLVVNSGSSLTMQGNGYKYLAGATLINQGTINFNGPNASIYYGTGSVISNGGSWLLNGDYGLSYYNSGSVVAITNSGIIEKVSGACTASFSDQYNNNVTFCNQPNGIVQVDSGTLQFQSYWTNYAGTLRLNGGTLNANGTFAVAGGSLIGSGTFGANAFSGGTISPGSNGAALIAFSSGLSLNSNVTLVIDGNGPVPGTMYDQLSVTGAVTLANCNLQITAMPVVPAGTSFMLINNDGTDAVTGTFNGLPENSTIAVGAQTFRIHYAGGTGNDVTLVRDGAIVGPLLSLQGITNGTGYFSGSGAIPFTTFSIGASTNLVTWTNIGVVTSSISGMWNFTDTNAWRYQRRFYNTTN